MRPSRRLLILCAVGVVLSILLIAAGQPPQAAIVALVLLALASLVDLSITPGRRRMALDVVPGGEVFCGETARLPARLVGRGGLPAIAEARVEVPEALGGQASFGFAPTGATTAQGEIRLPATRRGIFAISGVWVRWLSRFGLWEITPRFALDHELRVIPNVRPVVSGQIDATVQSELYGIKDTVTRGEGSEFHQLVEFTTGMDTRAIDWKRSARHRGLVAKEMRAERNHQIILALDNGYLMRGQVEGLARIDHAINAALSVAWAAGLGGDLVGLYSFDAEPRHYSPPEPARTGFASLRSRMAQLEYTSVESNHTLALAHLNGRLKRRSLIVIFSDFADTTTAELLVENLGVLSRAHLVLFVTLSDPGLARRQEGAARTGDEVAEAVVAAEMLRDRQLVLDRLARMGVLCLETQPGELTAKLLSTYLDIKSRELI